MQNTTIQSNYLSPMVVANWKMYGNSSLLCSLQEALMGKSQESRIIIMPPAVFLPVAKTLLNDIHNLSIGIQNVHYLHEGAVTGEISAGMARATGCDYALVGHSERRTLFAESNAEIKQKFIAIQKANMIPILCLGETQTERDSGETTKTLLSQLDAVFDGDGECLTDQEFVLAYEPVWAIGSGQTPEISAVKRVHDVIATWLDRKDSTLGARTTVLYGGSVSVANVSDFINVAGMNGVLVGRASLNVDKFIDLIAIVAQHRV